MKRKILYLIGVIAIAVTLIINVNISQSKFSTTLTLQKLGNITMAYGCGGGDVCATCFDDPSFWRDDYWALICDGGRGCTYFRGHDFGCWQYCGE